MKNPSDVISLPNGKLQANPQNAEEFSRTNGTTRSSRINQHRRMSSDWNIVAQGHNTNIDGVTRQNVYQGGQEGFSRVETIRRRLEMDAIQKQADLAATNHYAERKSQLANFYSKPSNKFQTMPMSKKNKKDSAKGGEKSGFRATLKRMKDAIFGTKKKPVRLEPTTNGESATAPVPMRRVNTLPPNALRKENKRSSQRKNEAVGSLDRKQPRPAQIPSLPDHSSTTNRTKPPDQSDGSMIPLQKGFPNLGNSCYWNAVLQCVGAMEPLASYYLEGHHKQFIDRLENKSEGSQYELNIVFGKLMEAMWRNTEGAHHIQRIRTILTNWYNSVFSQSAQEDAQEFLMTLTRYLYESSLTTVDTSIFGEVCGGMIGESLLCQNCGFEGQERSMYHEILPMSFPEEHQHELNYTLIRTLGRQPRVSRRSTRVDVENGVRGIASLISHSTNIPHNKLLLFQTTYSSFAQCLVTTYDITRPRSVIDGDSFHATELEHYPLGLDGYERVNCIFVHTIQTPTGRKRVTEPFICKLAISDSYSEIAHCLLKASGGVVRSNQNDRWSDLLDMFTITMHDDNLPGGLVLNNNPTCQSLIEVNAQRNMDEYTRILPWLPRFLRLVIEWKSPLSSAFMPDHDNVVCHSSFDSTKAHCMPTLHTLFKHYFQPAFTDGWRCESCLEKGGIQRAYYKKPPKIMVVMLKRFQRQDHGIINKIETPLSIALERFDASMFCEKPGRKLTPEEHCRLLYDVIGLVCHTGTITRGHYYAYTRNPVNNVWRRYDDNVVTVVKEFEIDTRDAYMVFMQQRSARISRQEVLAKRKEGGFLHNIRMHKWGRSDRNLNREREPLNLLPNGPLVNQGPVDEKRSLLGFRRDDVSRRPASSMNGPRSVNPTSHPNATLPRRENSISRAMPEFRNTIDGLLSRNFKEKDRKETEI